jgi:NitT/TauT family transport system substrate-binding protein
MGKMHVNRSRQSLWIPLLFLVLLLSVHVPLGRCQNVKVGTWKTAQTIQPFYYDKFLPPSYNASTYSFTNPADQKVALLAGSLDMCGTTLAHAIHSASR